MHKPALLLGLVLVATPIYSQTPIPYTSFQTPTGYRADNDIRTDAVIVYSDAAARIRSWKDMGFIVQTMYGFRTYEAYIREHPDEVQTTSDGTLHTCGPGSYYMVPTQNRIDAAVRYFTNAINAGTQAVIPEEPEFFACTGYSESFKRAWSEHYGEPWEDQTTSICARYKSERLKAKMEYDMIRAIFDAAEQQSPEVRRMVACHSPVSYFAWRIIYPHYQCLTLPNLQEVIGQVWTGTARSPARYEGESRERTFEYALLEYSSLYNLVRGTDKRMWFLMDPLEDNPNRSMEDYHINYEKTLVASLMFPEVDAYEVMPWPTRIYGRVPDDFAIEIGTVINALEDMHNQQGIELDTGTRGIATFVADSMGWQRADPHPSNYDSLFGLTFPLIYRGIPIQIAQLERVVDEGYLDPYEVLFLSYDILKPMAPVYNQAIADWVKRGGVLVFFGGTDAYNAVPEWWRDAGFASPQQDLYNRLGVSTNTVSLTWNSEPFEELARETERLTGLENKDTYRFDLSRFARDADTVYVKFSDAFRDDGWGALVESVKLTADGETHAAFDAGTDDEQAFILDDQGSKFNGFARFADCGAYWVYRFDVPRGSQVALEVVMGNQFLVECTSKEQSASWEIDRGLLPEFARDFECLDSIPCCFPLTLLSSASAVLTLVPASEIAAHTPIIAERKVGKGLLAHVGISPAYFASSAGSADLLRAITRHACDSAGLEYVEQQHIGIRRGSYVALRAWDEKTSLTGNYIDLLDPRLELIADPTVGPDNEALFCDVTDRLACDPRTPCLLYTSSKVESRDETADAIRLELSGPLRTLGAARVFTAGKRAASIEPDDAFVQYEGDTMFLKYPNNPNSVRITINWQ